MKSIIALAISFLFYGQPSHAQKPKTGMRPPFAGGSGKGVETDPQATKLEAAAVKAEKASKAKPKDTKLREQAAEAYYKAGYAFENSTVITVPKAKYRPALRLFRKALALNPRHPGAAAEKKRIEDVYKQMGMPIPV
jgi:tetratricopeptide (TPR) repeat protein